jgi:hypothetical protein
VKSDVTTHCRKTIHDNTEWKVEELKKEISKNHTEIIQNMTKFVMHALKVLKGVISKSSRELSLHHSSQNDMESDSKRVTFVSQTFSFWFENGLPKLNIEMFRDQMIERGNSANKFETKLFLLFRLTFHTSF